MYSTFSLNPNRTRRASKAHSIPADQPRAKRTPVPVACDHCRKNRIKCNNSKPCDNCKARNLVCSHADTTETRGLIRQVQVLVDKVDDLESRLQRAQNETADRANQAPAQTQLQSPELSTESPTTSSTPSSTSHSSNAAADTDSDGSQATLDLSSDLFAAKIDALLRRQNWPTVLSTSLVASTHASLSASDRYGRVIDPVTFPRDQQDYYIRLYWRQIHRNLPVIDEDVFKARYAALWDEGTTQDSRPSSSLVDIVLALALQLDFYSRPGGMPRHRVSENDCALDWTWSTADALYRSCSDDLNRECESPSWSTLQCYILMVVYLRNEGRHNSAYQVLGFAIRLSHVLNLHRDYPLSTPREDLRLRDQMRDFLICLDTQQFLEQTRPCGIVSCVPRQHLPLDPANRCFWSYWSELMSITKGIYIHSLRCTVKGVRNSPVQASPTAMARLLESLCPTLLEPLMAWARNVPPKYQLKRKSGGTPFSLDFMAEVDVDVPTWQMRQRLLLELSFHWVNMNFWRWFVDADDVSASTGGVVNPAASKEGSESAVSHAFAIIGIIDEALHNTDAIYGWYDAHLIQWDAALVLIGFMLCRPEHSRAEEASSMLIKCGSIFESLGTRLSYQAAAVIREFNGLKSRLESQYCQPSDVAGPHPQQLSFLNGSLTKTSHMDQLLMSDAFGSEMDFDLVPVDLPPSGAMHASSTL